MVQYAVQNQQKNHERNLEQKERETEAYNAGTLSSTKRKIIEYVARNPGESHQKIAKSVDCSRSYASHTRSEHRDTIIERGLELGEELDKFQISDGRQRDNIVEYSDLTEVQKFIISQYYEIKHKTDKSKGEIVKHILDNNPEELTTDGTRASAEYIKAVITEFSHLYDSGQERKPQEDMAVKTKSQQESVERETTGSGSRENLSEYEEIHTRLEMMEKILSSCRRAAEVEAEQQRGQATSAIARVAVLETVEEEIEEILEILD